MDEASLLEKLRRIEALFAGATTEGEKIAAAEARRRIQGRLELLEKEAPPVEYRFRLDDPWSRKVFTALCRRYDVRTYRYRGQKRFRHGRRRRIRKGPAVDGAPQGPP
jgi:hypothetical protein